MTAIQLPTSDAIGASKANRFLFFSTSLVLVLFSASLVVGVGAVSYSDLLADEGLARTIFFQSRVPRSIAVALSGASIAVAGTLMQSVTQNRFVSPSTAGTMEAAVLGIVLISIYAPSAPIWMKMLGAVSCALVGTFLFVAFIQRLKSTDIIMVPLIGIMIGVILESIAMFLAFSAGLLQAVQSWMLGDFSTTISGRYELLYIVGIIALVGYLFADRFTLVGVGREFSVNVGLNYDRTVIFGMVLVSLIGGIVVVVAGAVPFLGLIVPNLVTERIGDNQRRALPIVATTGAGILLACDLASRLIRYPFEIPVGTIMGVVGGVVFLGMLLRSRS